MARELTPQLGWLRHLPEAGTIRERADKESDLLRRRAELLQKVADIDTALRTLIKAAAKDAAGGWRSEEITAAKEAAGGG